VRTFDEGWTEAATDATDCRLCHGTGYLQHGMVITEEDWVSTLVACSHPNASPEIPAETDNHTGQLRSERVVRPEARPAVDRDSGPGPGGTG